MIIVFGSLNMDMVFSISRFPVTGETILCPDYQSISGGKGANQAIAAARAGAKVAMVGKVGDDAFGRRILNKLKQQGVIASGVGQSEKPTGCASILVNSTGENSVVAAGGANLDAAADQIPEEILTKNNTVLLQLELTAEESWAVLKKARATGARTILNISPAHAVSEDMLALVNYVIMNEVEARQFAKLQSLNIDSIDKIARHCARVTQGTCIVTLGGKGVVAVTPTEIWVQKAMPIKPVDTTGAGDAFCGIFAAALEAGLDLPQALHRASIGAGLSCLALGAQEGLPVGEDIDAAMDQIPPPQKIPA